MGITWKKGSADRHPSVCTNTVLLVALRAQGSKEKQNQDKWHSMRSQEDEKWSLKTSKEFVKKCYLVNKEIP